MLTVGVSDGDSQFSEQAAPFRGEAFWWVCGFGAMVAGASELLRVPRQPSPNTAKFELLSLVSVSNQTSCSPRPNNNLPQSCLSRPSPLPPLTIVHITP